MNENYEIWRPVKGFEGLYEVSNMGNVRSLDHYSTSGKRQFYKGKQLNPTSLPSNHLIVGLCYNGKQNGKLIHRLVAQAFPEICGELFDGCEVHHIDHNPKNNEAVNLKVMSKEEHSKLHKDSSVTKEKMEQIQRHTQTVFQYDYNWNYITFFNSTIEAAEAVNGDVESLRSAAKDRKKNGTHFYKGYRWLYAS